MKTRTELINEVSSIGEDAKALLKIAQNKATQQDKKANLSQAEIKQIGALIKRSEETVGQAAPVIASAPWPS